MPADEQSTNTILYRSYLLRLWKEHAQEPWRASLQNARDGAKHGFASLESMVAFLCTQTDDDEPGTPTQATE